MPNLSHEQRLAEIDRFAEGAPFVLCISRTEDSTGYDIRDVSDGPSLPEARAELEGRGRVFLGAVAIRDGQALSRLAEPVPEPVVRMLASSCLAHLAGRLDAAFQRLGLAVSQSSAERVQ
ncbi:hypothetical protein [Terriglobus aquaticus]|uniref:Uncharacterized protein n=1 Tax=Terriglobus aquaticus TaxID=940139 RepID=A0ABW9KIW7_9BACT|nr:hypothetical protein [Terriglobus aquaticus]